MVSAPVTEFAFNTASRKLQSPATPLQALAIGETGTGSSKRLTVNVGSGIGISIEGAISPLCKARIPGRLSTLMRNGNAATGEPLYDLMETCPGANADAPECAFSCEITAI